jgi:hypothetical protein
VVATAGDQELLARQAALQAEAAEVLAELDRGTLFGDVGPVLVVGSSISGLMCWRDLDVEHHASCRIGVTRVDEACRR